MSYISNTRKTNNLNIQFSQVVEATDIFLADVYVKTNSWEFKVRMIWCEMEQEFSVNSLLRSLKMCKEEKEWLRFTNSILLIRINVVKLIGQSNVQNNGD